MAFELEKLIIRLHGDTKQFKTEMRKASRIMDQAADSFVAAGKRMTIAVSAPLVAIGAASTKAFADFDSNMTKSAAIMRGLTGEMRQDMEDLATVMSDQGIRSASELAEAYFFLTSAGLSTEESLAALPLMTEFSTAGMFSLAHSTDLVTDAFSALGFKTGTTAEQMEKMRRVADTLTEANMLANATVEQFSIALTTRAGAAMKAYNIEVEEGVAVLAAMADQGVKAQRAGTEFDRLLRLMAKSTLKNTEAHRKYGFAVFDETTGKIRKMADIVANLEQITSKLSDTQRTAALDAMGFDARVQQVILPLLGTSEAIREYHSEMVRMQDTTREVSEKQLTSFASQMKILRNQIQNTGRVVGEVLAPFLQQLTKLLADAGNEFRKLPRWIQTVFIALGVIVATVGPLLVMLGALGGIIAGVSAGLNVLAVILGGPLAIAFRTAAIANALFNSSLRTTAVLLAAFVAFKVGERIGKELAEAFFGAESGARALQDRIDRLKGLNVGTIAFQERNNMITKTNLDQIKDLERRTVEYAEAIKLAESNLRGLESRASGTARMIEDMQTYQGPPGGIFSLLGLEDWLVKTTKLHRTTADFEAELQALNQQIISQQTDVEGLKDEYSRLQNQLAMLEELIDQELKEDIEQLTLRMKDQIATFGMSSNAAEIYRLQQREAGKADILRLQALNLMIEAQERNQKAMEDAAEKTAMINKEGRDQVKQMEQQVRFFHLTARQARIAELAEKGVRRSRIEAMKQLDRELTLLEKRKQLMERGKQLTKQMLTPTEQLRALQQELKELLEAGAINWTTAERAVRDFVENMQDEEIKLKVSVEGVEAVEAGSIEALTRLQGFQINAPGATTGTASKTTNVSDDPQYKETMKNLFESVEEAVQEMVANGTLLTVAGLSRF